MANPIFLFDNRFADGELVVSGTASGYLPSNLIDWRPFTWWKSDDDDATATVDTGNASAKADTLIIEPHTIQSVGGGATVYIKGSTDGDDWTTIASVSVTSDDPVLLTFTQATWQWWRVEFDATNPFEIGMMCLGNRLEIPSPLNEGFDPLGRKVSERTNVSMTGQVLGRIIRGEEWSQSLSFQHLTWDWVREEWEPAWETHLIREPFYFCWDPEIYPIPDTDPQEFYDYISETRVVIAGDSFKTPHRAGRLCDLSLEISGVA